MEDESSESSRYVIDLLTPGPPSASRAIGLSKMSAVSSPRPRSTSTSLHR